MRVGTTSFTVKQLTENIVSALPAIIALIPKKWKNIQGIFLKVVFVRLTGVHVFTLHLLAV